MGKSIVSVMTAACVALAAISASAAEIVDQGKFFSAAALKSANQTIAELERKYNHQIHIETYETVPGGKAEAVEKMSPSERNAFFVSWIKDRTQATRASGLFLLICKHPAHVHPAVGARLVKQGFNSQARDRVANALLDGFRSKQYDEGLERALTQVRTEFSKLGPTRMAERSLPSAPAPRGERVPSGSTGGNYGGILMIGLLVVGGLILFSLVGRMFSGGTGGTPGMGLGGGGFGSSLLGGLFGAMAGHWLYDSFSGHHGQAYGDDRHSGFGGDSHAGGDDFGSGADFGGGGDFDSGGDFGGGGDF